MRTLELDLSQRRQRQLLIALSAVNVLLTCTTAAFITAWARLDTYSPPIQRFVKYWLVQGHLATENVLAAWYSSMLLLAVGVACVAALIEDRRRTPSWLSWGWGIVALMFVTLSLDEIGSFHERIGMMRSLGGGGDKAIGWVFVLAIPIAAVGLFLLAFAALHVRRSRPAFRWMAAGVVMFLANPLFESVEMSLIHGRGAQQGTSQRLLHDVLLVLEEGGLELFGILCFLMAVLAYLRAVAGERTHWQVPAAATWFARAAIAAMVFGVYASNWVVARLPAGDTGIPSNWFPAAAWLVVFLVVASRPGRAVALCLSGFFGAGLYGYVDWLGHGFPHAAAMATVLAGWTLEGALRGAPPSPGVSVSACRRDR